MITVEDLLRQLVGIGGSDLHVLAGLPPAIRLHGDLTPIDGLAKLTPDEIKEMIYKVLTRDQIEKFENDPHSRNELDFAMGVTGVGRFRFNVHRQRGTIGIVVRALSSEIPALEKLGLPDSVWPLCNVKKGLSLVTGPTGSGKSTTLAAIIARLNETRADHILTIEDPIEYVHNSKRAYVTQREVGDGADTLSFKNALKYALRQDPDIILIGEMRDYDTIGIAVTSAETGHLVFGTLHTSSASQTVGRMIDVFPSDQQPQIVVQLSQNLQAVISQILLPRADTEGRVVCAEVMKCNPAVRNCIRSNKVDGIYQAIQTGSSEGMVTMDANLIRLAEKGIINYEIAKPHIRDETTHQKIKQVDKSPAKPKEAPAAPAPPPPPPASAQPPSTPPDPGSRSKVAIPPWEQQG